MALSKLQLWFLANLNTKLITGYVSIYYFYIQDISQGHKLSQIHVLGLNIPYLMFIVSPQNDFVAAISNATHREKYIQFGIECAKCAIFEDLSCKSISD